jgi:hypothetical protein
MNTRIASIACLLLLATPILAQSDAPSPQAVNRPVAAQALEEAEAKIVISAPSVVRIGELARLDISESVADSFKWLLVPQTPDFLVYDAGSRAVFSGRTAGEYQFIVACAKGGTVDVVTHVIRVIGPPAQPTTDSLTEWLPFWNWTLNLPADECDRLADSFEGVAAMAFDLDEPGDWIKATAAANRDALGERIDAWKPMLDRIGAVLKKRAESGALMTPEQHRDMWLEIAAGLREAALANPAC